MENLFLFPYKKNKKEKDNRLIIFNKKLFEDKIKASNKKKKTRYLFNTSLGRIIKKPREKIKTKKAVKEKFLFLLFFYDFIKK
jgi:hypothetical protein